MSLRRTLADAYYRGRATLHLLLGCCLLPLIPARLVDRVLGFPVGAVLLEAGMPARARQEIVYRCLVDWMRARLFRRAWAAALVARARASADLVYCAALTYPDIVTERLAVRALCPGRAVLVVLHVEAMGGDACRAHFDDILDVEGNLYVFGRVMVALAPRLTMLRHSGGMFQPLAVFLATARAPFVYRASGFINQFERDDATDVAAIALERAALRRATLALHNYDDGAVAFLEARLGLAKLPHLPVVPGVHRLLAIVRPRTENAEPHVGFFGGYVAPGDAGGGLHSDFLNHWRWLADGKVHVHVSYSHTPRAHPRLKPVRDALGEHPYFHLYDPLPFVALLDRVQDLDFVWAYFAAPFLKLRPAFRRFMGSNTVVGLCVGVPVITNAYYEPLYSSVQKDGNGLALPTGLGPELAEIVWQADRRRLREAALAVRERYVFAENVLVERLRPVVNGRAAVVPETLEKETRG